MKSFLCFIFVFAAALTVASVAHMDARKTAMCTKPEGAEKAEADPRLLMIF